MTCRARNATSEFALGLIQAAIFNGNAPAARRFRRNVLRNPCRWLFRCVATIGVVAGFLSCTPPTRHTTAPAHNANIDSSQRVDDERVATLLAPTPGAGFRLGGDNPNSARNFQIERKTPALPRSDGELQFWTVAAHESDYASGGSGKTTRLHVYATGGQQTYTWKTQKGFLATPSDLRNQEFIAFVRVHGITDPRRAAITLKIRGGAHTAKNPDLASCTMVTFQSASTGAVARFGKELTHPNYDYVALTPAFDATLNGNRWFGKLLATVHQTAQLRRQSALLDNDPFDPATGRRATTGNYSPSSSMSKASARASTTNWRMGRLANNFANRRRQQFGFYIDQSPRSNPR
jgi:hypothetical protein